jgi:hypothetical protein
MPSRMPFRMNFRALLEPDTRARRIFFGLLLYIACTAVFWIVASPARLFDHTPYNHYALLAEAWLHGRQDLAHGPPGYAGNNDFAAYGGKTYISFPPFPAVLMLPFVAMAGAAERFYDGQFIVLLAGVAPAVLFLVLEKLRRTGRSSRSEAEDIFLAALMGVGTVYFFTAVEGTVWFAALVVNTSLMALYALFALDAEAPLLAGMMLGFVFATRVTPILAVPLFALEAVRVTADGGLPTDGTFLARLRTTWSRLDKRAWVVKYALFAAPILVVFAVCSWMNHSRFGSYNPSDFGHEYLSVAWRTRMAKWGIVDYHYLSKNLGCFLTILPWLPPRGAHVSWFDASGMAPFQINEHGLALWFTAPIYFWLLWPRSRGWLHAVLLLSIAGPALADLFYQNTGWRQFGYRFSNDYVILLFMLLAVGGRPFGALFRTAAAWGIAVNLFGAVTFDRNDARFDRFYFRDGSQVVMYQPD